LLASQLTAFSNNVCLAKKKKLQRGIIDKNRELLTPALTLKMERICKFYAFGGNLKGKKF
jgi:hypothetical protein